MINTDVKRLAVRPVVGARPMHGTAQPTDSVSIQGAGEVATTRPVAARTLDYSALTGRVLLPGDEGWETERRNFCTRVDYSQLEPKVIVFCQNKDQVVDAVNWARTNNVPLRVRSGRHSYEAYSMVKDGIVIDVSEMDDISIDRKNGTATIGSGCAVQPMYERLWQNGVTIPAATAASVGMGGLTLGGGFGMTSRKFGLTCDNMLDAEVVLADGRVVHANKDENPDLYWALRGGGGGNFGVVTHFTFQTHPVSNVMLFQAQWDWSQFNQVVDFWQKWAPKADDRMAAFLRLTQDRKITLFAQYTPDGNDDLPQGQHLFETIVGAVPPIQQTSAVVPYINATRSFSGVDQTDPKWLMDTHGDRQIFKSSSAMAYEPLPLAAIDSMRQALETAPSVPGEPNQPSMIQLLPGGGKSARTPTEVSVAYHRAADFVIQYDAYWTNPQDAGPNVTWVANLRDHLAPHTRGAYVNYHDAELKDPLQQYYGPNLPRLIDIKTEYDPTNLFNYPQSIPVKAN